MTHVDREWTIAHPFAYTFLLFVAATALCAGYLAGRKGPGGPP